MTYKHTQRDNANGDHDMTCPMKNYHKKAVLDDGSAVLVRAIAPSDKDMLAKAFSELDRESVQMRFFRNIKSLSAEELKYFTEVDFVNHVAIGVGLLEDDKVFPIGVGRYIVDKDHPKKAEIALTVDEFHRGIGVGTLMLRSLCDIAKENGIEVFEAVMLDSNTKIINVLNRSKLPLHISSEHGVTTAEIYLVDD